MAARALSLAVAALLAAACGPRPRVQRVSARTEPGGRVLVRVDVDNRGGSGEASLTIRLRDRATGAVVVKEGGLPLDARKSGSFLFVVEAPPADYEPSAELRYPP